MEYPNRGDTVNMAQTFFGLNKPKEMDGDNGESYIRDIKIYDDSNDPRYPSVAVRAQGKMKTIWMKAMNRMDPSVDLSQLNAERCGQSESTFMELNGKYVKVAQGACD